TTCPLPRARATPPRASRGSARPDPRVASTKQRDGRSAGRPPARPLPRALLRLNVAARPLGKRNVDLAGPPSNHLSPAAGAAPPRARRGARAGDRPGDDGRGARADG